MFLRALKFCVRTCYASLKGVVIALYEFLEEEEPSPHASAVGLASTDFGTARGGSIDFGDTRETQYFGTAQGIGLNIGDTFVKQDSHPMDGITRSTQAEDTLDWTTSVGVFHVEADVPAVGDVSSSPIDHRVTTDIVVHTGLL